MSSKLESRLQDPFLAMLSKHEQEPGYLRVRGVGDSNEEHGLQGVKGQGGSHSAENQYNL